MTTESNQKGILTTEEEISDKRTKTTSTLPSNRKSTREIIKIPKTTKTSGMSLFTIVLIIIGIIIL